MPEVIQKEILSALDLRDFVTVDIETTVLDYEREDIIEFGAVHFRDGKQADNLNLFIKPSKAIPENITRITGITDADVKNSSSFGEVIEAIQGFIKDYPVVAHNVNFDLPFLEYHARRFYDNFRDWNYHYKDYYYFRNRKIDTVVLSKLFLHFLPSSSLKSLKKYFQFSTQMERADQ
jgi:ATP-dependent DNA helicase DinG